MSILDLYHKKHIADSDKNYRRITAQYWNYNPRNSQDVRMYNAFLDKLEKDVEKAEQYRADPTSGDPAELLETYKEYKRMMSLFGDGSNAPPFNISRQILSVIGNLEPLYGKDEDFIREYSETASRAETQIEKMEGAVEGYNIELIKDLLPAFSSSVNDFLEKTNIQESTGSSLVPEQGIHMHGRGMNVSVYDRDQIYSMKNRVQKIKDYLNSEFRQDIAALDYDVREIENLLANNEIADTGIESNVQAPSENTAIVSSPGQGPQDTQEYNYPQYLMRQGPEGTIPDANYLEALQEV